MTHVAGLVVFAVGVVVVAWAVTPPGTPAVAALGGGFLGALGGWFAVRGGG
jgi:hypothetical protein